MTIPAKWNPEKANTCKVFQAVKMRLAGTAGGEVGGDISAGYVKIMIKAPQSDNSGKLTIYHVCIGKRLSAVAGFLRTPLIVICRMKP
jgi:hypothetical protein